MTVVVSGDGAGAPTALELPAGATVSDLLTAVAPEVSPASFHVRVNRRPAGQGHVLRPGDRIALSPHAPNADG